MRKIAPFLSRQLLFLTCLQFEFSEKIGKNRKSIIFNVKKKINTSGDNYFAQNNYSQCKNTGWTWGKDIDYYWH